MLVIKPIQDKETQRQWILSCGGEYDPAAFAYMANECADDGETVLHPIGGCQFAIHGENGVISLLRCLPDIQDDEALMIMMRAATSFLFRCGIRNVIILPESAEQTLIRRLGFTQNKNGAWSLDLLRYYTSPCSERAQLHL